MHKKKLILEEWWLFKDYFKKKKKYNENYILQLKTKKKIINENLLGIKNYTNN